VAIVDQNMDVDLINNAVHRMRRDGSSIMEVFSSNVRKAIADGYVPVIGLNPCIHTDKARANRALRKVCTNLIHSSYNTQRKYNGRCIARTKDHDLWDILINDDGETDEDSLQRIMKAVWKYAPNRIYI
jgi:hypothetical protein